MKPARQPWYAVTAPSVLVYGSRKQADMIWPYTTEDEKRGAMLALFKVLDGYEFYVDLDENEDDAQAVLPGFEPPTEQAEQRALLKAARGGDADAARELLTWRHDYEYEDWSIVRLEKL
jgi:hypothetical protein